MGEGAAQISHADDHQGVPAIHLVQRFVAKYNASFHRGRQAGDRGVNDDRRHQVRIRVPSVHLKNSPRTIHGNRSHR
jgi:hypothetical protein